MHIHTLQDSGRLVKTKCMPLRSTCSSCFDAPKYGRLLTHKKMKRLCWRENPKIATTTTAAAAAAVTVSFDTHIPLDCVLSVQWLNETNIETCVVRHVQFLLLLTAVVDISMVALPPHDNSTRDSKVIECEGAAHKKTTYTHTYYYWLENTAIIPGKVIFIHRTNAYTQCVEQCKRARVRKISL